jgi:hypothetical protein
MFEPLDPSNVLLAGAGPHIAKAVSIIVKKWPALYDVAGWIAVAIAFLIIAILSVLPETIEAWLKVAIVVGGTASVYHDWKKGKTATTIKDLASAEQSAVQTEQDTGLPSLVGKKIIIAAKNGDSTTPVDPSSEPK